MNKTIRITLKVAGIITIFTLLIFAIKIIKHKSTIIIDEELIECYSNCNEVVTIPLDDTELIKEINEYKLANFKRNLEERKLQVAEDKRIAEEKRLVELEAKRIAKQKADEEAKQKEKYVAVSRGSGYESTYEATFYTSDCKGCTGKSTSGIWVNKSIYYQGYRVVAAPPGIPFYTKLRITLEDGSRMDAIVLDRGGDIKGKRLDILVSSKEEAYELGRQQVKVEVIQ